MKDQTLWRKIQSFALDQKDSEFTFSKRLARDNDWTIDYSKKVIEEYKKFIYLCCISNKQITPSDAVDQAWHLHLTYTKSYWKEFCAHTLKKEIHHNPTKGGSSEREKFSNCYDQTFQVYREEFGEDPDSKIWFDNKKRFKEINFKRINASKYWMIRKPATKYLTIARHFTLVVLIPMLFVRAMGDFVAGLIVFAILVGFMIFKGIGSDGDDGCSGCSWDSSCSYDSGCSSSGCSGCGGCGD